MASGSAFKTAEWVAGTNIYEVNLRQYTPEGSFRAFSKELPRLKNMGVHTLWFMPVTPIAQKNKKGTLGSYYACSDYTAVNPEFGTLEEFRELVAQAHRLGFKVIMDWVANHTGWDHVWTMDHPAYFLRDALTNDFKMAHGMEDIIELDYSNTAVRKAMIDAMEFWIRECDIDGYRCDLAFWVTLDFWRQARPTLDAIKELFWLGEFDPIDNPEYLEVFDAAYSWTWMHKTETFYKEDPDLGILKDVLQRYDTICGTDKMLLWFTSNHDENSWNGTEYEKYGEMAKALAVFSFTRNGIPLVYSGQELPNQKRLKFFDKDCIDWDGHYRLQDFYKTLMTLKKNNPALRAGDAAAVTLELAVTDKANGLAYLRKNSEQEVLVLLNLENKSMRYEVNDKRLSGRFSEVFSKRSIDITPEMVFDLPPWGYLVYEKKP